MICAFFVVRSCCCSCACIDDDDDDDDDDDRALVGFTRCTQHVDERCECRAIFVSSSVSSVIGVTVFVVVIVFGDVCA